MSMGAGPSERAARRARRELATLTAGLEAARAGAGPPT